MQNSSLPDPKNPQRAEVEALSELIQEGMRRLDLTAEKAAERAKDMNLGEGLSHRNIYKYIKIEAKSVSERIVRRFALLFDETPEHWLRRFPRFGKGPPLLLDRDAIVRDQANLRSGDEIVLISSRAFLEATNQDIAKVVLTNLSHGVVYTYYFPEGSSHPYGTQAFKSYQTFRDKVSRSREFRQPPLLFGYSVDPARFRFFSPLQTIVRFHSRIPGLDRVYAYIEIGSGNGSDVVPSWYILPTIAWDEIARDLDTARSAVADFTLPILPLNPCLRTVSAQYAKWFKQAQSVRQYASLRPILGHSGVQCLDAVIREIGRTQRKQEPLHYLDIGCGDGTLTYEIAKYLANEGALSVTGLDISAAQLRAARKAFGTDIPFTVTELAFENFDPGDKFEVITAIHSLYTVDEAYIRRVFSLLAPRGIACIWMAKRAANVVSALCDVIDDHLRPGQRRNAAEDVERYAALAGLSPQVNSFERTISGLLNLDDEEPTLHGQQLINFCALGPTTKGTVVWKAAAAALHGLRTSNGDYPLNDALIVIQRDD
jgi:SAM-dependent methyltransferase